MPNYIRWVDRTVGQSIIFPEIKGYITVLDQCEQNVRLCPVMRKKDYTTTIWFGEGWVSVFTEFPAIGVIGGYNENHETITGKSKPRIYVNSPKEVGVIRSEHIFKGEFIFPDRDHFDEDGNFVLGQKKYQIILEDGKYRAKEVHQ